MDIHDFEDDRAFLETIRKLPLFQIFPDEALTRLLGRGLARVVSYAPDETIIEHGNYEKTFFVLLDGSVRISRNAREIGLLAEPGAIFGEMAFILGQARTATVTAATAAVCLEVNMAYVDFFPSPEREAFLTAFYRYLAPLVEKRLGSANSRKAAILRHIREIEEEIEDFSRPRREAMAALKAELDSLDASDDETVLRRILDRRF